MGFPVRTAAKIKTLQKLLRLGVLIVWDFAFVDDSV